jgi:predicted AAA+ superfamily ATPase
LRLSAGRTAQEVNLSALGGDGGVSHNAARVWLSVLEASYIVHRLPAGHRSTRKQVVKAPKLHFFDSGLLCYLLGIREPGQLRLHPLRGAVFESWVIAELYKGHVHRGVEPSLFHYRETRGVEVDLLITRGERWQAIEVKSGEPSRRIEPMVVYGGDRSQQRSQGRVVAWTNLPQLVEGV